ncbi:MAG TPA: hypothetical protein PKD10_17575 [Paracoccaceae bacterium]|nr:hypothetical protein [Paracoccaceae bacterium]HMO72034.1 hypothetical protein [Paracoccaceae bacterium]
MGLALAFLAAGAAAVLAMGWTALVALSAEGARGRGVALLAVLAVVACAPLVGRGLAAGGVALPAWTGAAGVSLLMAAAMLCLWRLRAVPGSYWPARAGMAACMALWIVLVLMRGAPI